MAERNPVGERAVDCPAGGRAGGRDQRARFRGPRRRRIRSRRIPWAWSCAKARGSRILAMICGAILRLRSVSSASAAILRRQIAGAPDQLLWGRRSQACCGLRDWSLASPVSTDSGQIDAARAPCARVVAQCQPTPRRPLSADAYKDQSSTVHVGLRRRSPAYCFSSSRVKRRRIAACDLGKAGVDMEQRRPRLVSLSFPPVSAR